MSINYSFAGKRVLIVGGTHGVGLRLVHRFHDGGATVFVVDEDSEAVNNMNRQLSNVYAEAVDLTDSEVTIKVIKQFGWIDHLVNNLEIKMPHTVQQDTSFSFCGVQIAMAMKISEIVTKSMIENGAQLSIVDVYSIYMKNCMDCCCYASTKKVLKGLVKAAAKELRPYNIRMNCIIKGVSVKPPLRDTSRLSKNVLEIMKRLIVKMTTKSTSETDEMSDMVFLMLSPLASLFVGQSLVIRD